MRNKAFLAMGLIVLSACIKDNYTENRSLEEKDSAKLEVYTSKISGQQFSNRTARTDRLIVKFSEDFVQQVEKCQADVKALAVSVKSEENPVTLLESSTLERVFPDAGEFEERSRRRGLHRWYYIDFDEGIGIVEAESILNGCSAVESVEVELVPRQIGTVQADYSVALPRAEAYPFDDPNLSKQWHYYNDGSMSSSKEGCDINVLPIWQNYPLAQKKVIVAVVDGIVDFSHPDLEANLWTGEDGSHGKNFVIGGQNVVDDHGTHVAGTVAAVNNNGIGVCGVAGGDYKNSIPGAKIMSCGIFDKTSNGSSGTNGASAIKWAADHGAVIAQNSWGYDPDTDGDGKISDRELASFKARKIPDSLKEAIDYFIDFAGCDDSGNQLPESPMQGGIVFFAAGNNNIDYDVICSYDRVIAVASLGPDYTKASYSNYGDWVDISAPGGESYKGKTIYSTISGGSYGYMQGTSMACPHLSGVAALLLSHYQKEGFTSTNLRQIICGSIKNINSYNSKYTGQLGKGLINAARAISFSEEVPEPVEDFAADLHSNMSTISWSVPEDDPIYAYTVFISKSSLDALNPAEPSDEVEQIEIMGSECEAGSTASLYLDDLAFNTDYHLRIAAKNYLGMFSSLSEEIVLSIGANNPPVIEAVSGTDIEIKAHEKIEIEFGVYDPDGHSLSCSLSPEEKALSLSLKEDKAIVTVNALNLNPGQSYDFTLRVSDSYDEVSLPFKIRVQNNHSPKLIKEVPDLVFNGLDEKELTLKLSDYFLDEDGETLRYELAKNGTTVIKPSIQEDLLTLKPFSYGSAIYTLKAVDACYQSCECTFRILLRDGSRAVDLYPNPVVDYLNIRLAEDGSLEVHISNRAGSVVYQNSDIQTGPFSPYKLDMSGWTSGEYYIRAKGKDFEETYSIIKK